MNEDGGNEEGDVLGAASGGEAQAAGIMSSGRSLLEGEGMLDPGWPVCLSEPRNPTLTG